MHESEESLIRTSAVTVLSSPHGRLRRAERAIEKRDLQAAVKYGKKERGFPCPRTGEGRWKYTFADVVYVTDETSRLEITSWPAPGAGLDIELVEITQQMHQSHASACMTIKNIPSSWSSHTVVVVDQSGSMRKTDVAGGATRSDAVWLTLATDFVASQLEREEAGQTDVISIIGMNEESTVLIDRQPIDWILFNSLIHLLRSAEPKSAGNYIPALDLAESLLCSNANSSCALMLMFLSDGRPSDHYNRVCSSTFLPCARPVDKIQLLINPRIDALASRFGRRLAVHTIGFAAPSEDFTVLRAMAGRLDVYGSVGRFQAPSLRPESLGLAISSLTLSLTTTKSELTELGGGAQRQVRDVLREPRGAVDDPRLNADWDAWDIASGTFETRERWSAESGQWVKYSGLSTAGAIGIAMRRRFFGEGAERLVAKFREVGPGGAFVGGAMVAKESRFLQDLAHHGRDVREFHRVFCVAQGRAARLAEAFNARVEALPGFDPRTTPRIAFLDCCIYVVRDPLKGRIGLLVEKQLDPQRYDKWSSNNGYVKGAAAAPTARGRVGAQALAALVEGSEDEDSSEEEVGPLETLNGMDPAEFPQAFSHFTYRYKKRRMLVCDLQGVLTPAGPNHPPIFEMTDPVVHYKSLSGRKSVYGRTDLGKAGMHSFLKTHRCGELCRMLNRRWGTRGGRQAEEDELDADEKTAQPQPNQLDGV